MVGMEEAWLLPAIPLGAFVVGALFHNYLPRQGDWIAVGAAVAAFVLFLFVAGDMFGQLPAGPDELVGNTAGFDWIRIDEIDFLLRIGFRVDQITLVMLSVVTFVGMLIFIYAAGYMRDHEGRLEVRYGWFFSVLSLFIASMLTLVLADNFLLLYVAWEAVGICSFLLIGHHWERRSAVEAAKKAFVTTRFGDVFMLIGIILLWRETGTFDMSETFRIAAAEGFDKAYLTMATLFLFGGAMGKSAQFPFHVWLPDAMEGPTPVSALIHAATMVVAGIYLVARTMPLFEHSYDAALYFVVAVGMITTFLSVGMGLVMTDIKRVVAYSTLNSLGLMMVALGFGEPGVGPAMLYLFCHAFFKALLFLASGSVIHQTEQQEVERLGGLTHRMPITNATFLIGALAMAGMVPLSGFFAKDEVLVVANDFNIVVLILLLATLPFTAAYMLRIYMLAFTGAPRWQEAPLAVVAGADAEVPARAEDTRAHDVDAAGGRGGHAHAVGESPPIMSWPLIVLAGFAIVAGFVVFEPIGELIGLESGFLSFVENALTDDVHGFAFDWPMAVISTLLVVGGLLAARQVWGPQGIGDGWAERAPWMFAAFRNKFYLDDLYQWCINNGVLGVAKVIAFFDRAVVNDTGVNGTGEVTGAVGFVLKLQQTGKLPNYALAMIVGVAVLALAGFIAKG